MTVAALTAAASYSEDGVTLNFAAPFRYLDPTHLVVERIDAAGNITALTYGTQWSATSGATDAGGTVTLVSSTAGNTLRIRRKTPRAQTTDYVANDRFPAETHEATVDRAMLIDQEQDVSLADLLQRAILVPTGETAPALPSRASLLGKVLAVSAAGLLYGANFGDGGSGLRADLASVLGSALVGAATGGTVEDAIWHKGRTAPIAGSKAQINWLRDDAADPMENIGGLWVGGVRVDHGFNKVWSAANASGTNAPVTTVFVKAKNTGTDLDVVGLMAFAEVAATGKTVFGANIGVWSSGGANNYKLVGLEIDVQPQVGTTPLTVGGLYINMFSMQAPGPAIYIEGIFGGKWGTGLSVGNLSDTGSGIGPAAGNPRMGTLLDSGVAQYQIAAIKLNNLHKQLFYGASGNPAGFYVDAGNYMHAILPAQGWVYRNNTDTVSLVVIDNGGNFDLQAGGALKMASNTVLTGQQSGYGTPTGGSRISNFPGATATLVQTSQMLAQLMLDLKAGKMPTT